MTATADRPPGTLYVVATPLGNLDDISPRALEALRRAGLMACEDTRRTRQLLTRFGISPPRLISCHKFNERRQARVILAALARGQDVALVTDGGTPGVSDPGAHVVDSAFEAGLRVSPVPGPSAAAAAASVGGFESTGFLFLGFLPVKGTARRAAMADAAASPRPVILYEAPHRIARTVADLAAMLGARRVTVVREMTKIHEEVVRTDLASLSASLAGERKGKGEYTLVIEAAAKDGQGRPAEEGACPPDLKGRYALLLDQGIDPKEAVLRLARQTGLPRREVYRVVRG